MAIQDHIAVARDPAFAARVMMLSFKVAQQVAAEDPATANHANRANYSNIVFRGDENPKLLAAHAVSSNATMQQTIDANPQLLGADIPDGDIEFVLATIWDARANAFAP